MCRECTVTYRVCSAGLCACAWTVNKLRTFGKHFTSTPHSVADRRCFEIAYMQLRELEAASVRMNWAFLPRQTIGVGRSYAVVPHWGVLVEFVAMFSRPFRMLYIVQSTVWRVNDSAAGETWHQWQDVCAYAFNMSTKALTSFVVADYCNIWEFGGAHIRNVKSCFWPCVPVHSVDTWRWTWNVLFSSGA